ncbi:NAD-dependent epimerase/dehydratase family protein [Amycolatopsis sp.]|uniref:NAD-dependent epimerase/dehydratase family protein n=1 Tax=Amycolatopsis sp. TaxID=37632 RepID=UPI002CB1E8CA|nr:NAD-dependent epimerase/dehydratase family protein [Amycolatopsis sp.]HVV12727.1 NAD-dependent epimerase/dehydratase family protein [Amycolatopsis sp.]
MRLLVLGGTSFVGRAIVSEAAARGWSVTTFNRGRGAWSHPAASTLTGDRLRAADLAPLAQPWDAVVDTWSGAPSAVRDSARLLSKHAERYVYVSSRAVYASGVHGADETCALIAPEGDEYPQHKRGGEIAVEESFGDRALLARAGLIFGPHEDSGRLPHWLRRVERGGEVLAPGPSSLPVRYVDVRDLAAWLLRAVSTGLAGPYNVVNPLGHTTFGSLLSSVVEVVGGSPVLSWVDPLSFPEIHRWTELPGWLPPSSPLVTTDASRAAAAGLVCRPVVETVADTWAWVRESGVRFPGLGFAPTKEAALLRSAA